MLSPFEYFVTFGNICDINKTKLHYNSPCRPVASPWPVSHSWGGRAVAVGPTWSRWVERDGGGLRCPQRWPAHCSPFTAASGKIHVCSVCEEGEYACSREMLRPADTRHARGSHLQNGPGGVALGPRRPLPGPPPPPSPPPLMGGSPPPGSSCPAPSCLP